MPTVPEHVLSSSATPIRLCPQANVNKPQACQACQQRKRKCDRRRPDCSTCIRRKIPCVYELKITDRSHPNFLTDLLKSVEEKDKRIATLESLIQAQLPGVSIKSLSTDELATLSLSAAGPSTAPPAPLMLPMAPEPAPPGRDATFIAGKGSEKMSSALLASVEERLANLDFTAPSSKLTSVPTLKLTVVSFMHSQIGANTESLESVTDFTNVAVWPPFDLAAKCVRAFVNNNATCPIFRECEMLASLREIYKGNPDETATPLETFTFFLIFALGLVWLSRSKKGDKIDTTLLRNRSLSNLSAVLKTESGITCVSSLFLLSFWSVFDSGGPDLVPIYPIIVELALHFKLNQEPNPSLPIEEQDRRRALFWSIYNQERGMAGVLQTPVDLNDDDVTVSLPLRLDDLGPLTEGADPVVWYRHMIAMRQIFWDVFHFAWRNKPNDERRARLQMRLDDWHARNPRVEGADCDNYFDLYYHTIRAQLYRPSATDVVPVWQLAILEVSAFKSLQIAMKLYQERKWVDNPFHLSHAIAMGMSLLYSLLQNWHTDPSKQEDPDWRNRAISMIAQGQEVVSLICSGWPQISHLSRAFNELSNRILTTICGSYPNPLAEASSAHPELPPARCPDDGPPPQMDGLPGHTPNSDDAMWLNGAISNLQNTEIEMNPADLDAFMESIGWSQEWAMGVFSGGPMN